MKPISKLIPLALLVSLLASITSIATFATSAFADSGNPTSSVDFTVHAEPTISMITSTDLVLLDLAPAVNEDYDSASFTIHVGTNHPNGYHLFFNTEGDSNALISDNGYSINALPDTNNNNGYSESNFPANTWGYNSNGDTWSYKAHNTNFFPLSTSATEIDGYNGPINDKATTISLASKVDFESAAGNYTKRLIISMLPTVIAYDLSYDANTTDTVANLPTLELQDQWSDTTPSLTINTKFIPTRDGYNFKGYTTTNGGTTAEYAYDATTNTFTPSTLTPSTTSSTLYAVWEVGTVTFDKAFANAGKSKQSGYYKMQDMSTSICNAVTTGTSNDGSDTQVAQLIDTRDNKVYWVAKLLDGNCWMTQNLDLELSNSVPLTNELSDIGYGDKNGNNKTGRTSWTPENSTQNHQYKDQSGTEHSDVDWRYGGHNSKAYSYRPASDPAAGTSGDYGNDGDVCFSPAFMENGTTMANWQTMADCTNVGNSAELCAHWNVGTFYSWYAATAGTGNANVRTVTNVTDSICPKGWKLPEGNGGDFQGLVNSGMTASNISSAPYYFLRAGLYSGDYGAVYGTGNYGVYWSSTSWSDPSYAYYLTFGSDTINPANYSARYFGMGVRCVAR